MAHQIFRTKRMKFPDSRRFFYVHFLDLRNTCLATENILDPVLSFLDSNNSFPDQLENLRARRKRDYPEPNASDKTNDLFGLDKYGRSLSYMIRTRVLTILDL